MRGPMRNVTRFGRRGLLFALALVAAALALAGCGGPVSEGPWTPKFQPLAEEKLPPGAKSEDPRQMVEAFIQAAVRRDYAAQLAMMNERTQRRYEEGNLFIIRPEEPSGTEARVENLIIRFEQMMQGQEYKELEVTASYVLVRRTPDGKEMRLPLNEVFDLGWIGGRWRIINMQR